MPLTGSTCIVAMCVCVCVCAYVCVCVRGRKLFTILYLQQWYGREQALHHSQAPPALCMCIPLHTLSTTHDALHKDNYSKYGHT